MSNNPCETLTIPTNTAACEAYTRRLQAQRNIINFIGEYPESIYLLNACDQTKAITPSSKSLLPDYVLTSINCLDEQPGMLQVAIMTAKEEHFAEKIRQTSRVSW